MVSSITINNLSMGTYASGYLLGDLVGFDLAEVRTIITNRGNYSGARFSQSNYGKRAFTINGLIVASSPADFETKRRALQGALNIVNGQYTMVINTRGGLSLQSIVILSSIDMTYSKGTVTHGEFQIQLVSEFPFLQSSTQYSVTVTPFSGGGGEIPATIPFALATGGTGTETITNNGNGTVYPVIRIYGQIENPNIINETNDQTLSMTYNITSNTNYIEIDTYNRTLKDQSDNSVAGSFSGDFVTLASGANTIKLSSASYNSSARAIFTFRDNYLGI